MHPAEKGTPVNLGPPPSPYTASALNADRRKARRRRITLGAAVAALVVVAAAVWGLVYGGVPADRRPAAARQEPDDVRRTVETVPKSPAGEKAFVYDEEIHQVGAVYDVPGAWATDRFFAKGLGTSIKGIPVGGTESRRGWKLTFPGPLCALTRHVSVAGWTAVAYSGKALGSNAPAVASMLPCDRVAVVDLNAGRKLWEVKLPGENPPSDVNVTMTDGVVAVAWSGGSAAYDMTTGKRLWADTVPADCVDEGFAGGEALIALVGCGDSARPTFRVERIDPRTGRTGWTYRVPRGIKEVYLVSSSPAVIAVAAGDEVVTDLISLTGEGRYRATVRLNRGHQLIDCDETFSAVVESCPSIVVGERQVYIRTDEDIVAFELATGRSTAKFDSPTGDDMYPLRMSGDQLIAYRAGDGFSPNAIVGLDPVTRREHPLLLFGTGEEITELGDPAHDDILYEHGRAFFAARSVAGPRTKGEEGEITHVAIGVQRASG
jgi:hypothetical protein